uniref:hypothetical protein n=1 Tax=Phymatolithon calcareum TaxID=1277942 RepID=UPI0023EFA1BD|nr:hypothetical protein P6G74_pgp003 [Phymatolithon calcareum]WEA76924.1 hypothetical protein [Phymatolithon calcareum]
MYNIYFAQIDNAVMPSIYLIILLVFLLPVFIIITFQLVQIANLDYQFKILNQKDIAKNLNNDDIFTLVKICTKKRLWLSSIKLLETKCIMDTDSKFKYFNAIGFSYYSMKQYDLAKTYYLKSLSYKKDYLIALQNLGKTYEITNDFSLALETYRSIVFYYPGNLLANKNILKLKNRDSRI